MNHLRTMVLRAVMLFPYGAITVVGTLHAQDSPYTVTITSNFRPTPPTIIVPDISRFTVESVRRMMPAERNGKVRIGKASALRLLDEAFRDERGEELRRRQATDEAQIIVIEDGAVSIDQIVDQLDDDQFAQQDAGTVTIRLPLVVQHGAALVVDGQSTPTVRLSTDRGAFLANAGQLFVAGATVTSWSEDLDRPTLFENKKHFRPYITSYFRSKTYIANSRFEHLGFAAPSSYGFSMTSHPERHLGEPREEWPEGVLVGNEFRGLYYGFYSFEARDVAIVDNRYIDCIVYGIDPHDRSTRLLIANNTTTGTVERHGIIGSRGISNSFIMDNVSFQNTGSGIMLDRQCTGNLVRGNKVYRNGQGIAIYESPNNVINDNVIAFNTKSAVRVRNSTGVQVLQNKIVGHGDYALEVYAKRLDDHQKRVDRGDTYDIAVDAAFFGNSVLQNRGLVKARDLGGLRLSDIRQDLDWRAVANELVVKDYQPKEDDLKFGQDLEPLAEQLREVLNDREMMIEVREASE